MDTSIRNDNSNQENSETYKDEKNKLKKEIDELKSIILQITWSLNTLTFKDINNISDIHDINIPRNRNAYATLDIDAQLEFELFRYAGFYCVKFSEKEYVCNLSPSRRYEEENTFAVQVLNNHGTGALGKWIMPMSIDLDDLISKFSLDDLTNIPNFLRTCKHYVDCYFIRREQFNTLMDTVSRTKDCSLQTNLGYTCITLELIGVYNVEDQLYIDLIIYLIYAIDEARPYEIEIESKLGEELHENMKKHLKKSLKCFKMFDLHTAFNNMFNEKPFTWSKEEDDDSPVEIDIESSSDEEGFLARFSFSADRIRKRRRKNTLNVSKIFKSNEQPIPSRNKKKTVKNLTLDSVNEKSTTTEFTSDLNKRKEIECKLQTNNNSELQTKNNIISSAVITSTKKKTNEKLHKPCTSTPMKNKQNPSKPVVITDIEDISDITANEDNLSNARTKNDTDIKQGEDAHKSQTKDIVPAKVLQSKMKKNVKSLIGPKPISSQKTSSRKRLKKI